MDSATFDATNYRPTWFIKRLLVEGMAAVIGGPKKCLKTSLDVALAIALASGTPFLGEFTVYRSVRVALLSGESGFFTLQETARRICASQGLSLSDLGNRLLWYDQLPQLGNPLEVAALRDGLARDEVKVCIIDPLYLCLIAGGDQSPVQSEILYQVGPLLLGIARACLDAGATPVLVHHTKKGSGQGDPLDLDDLAYSGIAEFARQWLLVSRRETYEPGTGSHKLWLNVGGSTGQGGLWSVDVEEGELKEDFTGRLWEVTVSTSTEQFQKARDGKAEAKSRRPAEEDRIDDANVMMALDAVDPEAQGASYNRVRQVSRLSRGPYDPGGDAATGGGSPSESPRQRGGRQGWLTRSRWALQSPSESR